MTTTLPILRMPVASELDVVTARRRAREIAAALGFGALDQTRVASAVSEIARNAFEHGGGGEVAFQFERDAKPALAIEVRDRGPGIRDLQAVLDGTWRPVVGPGQGITASRRLVDRCVIESSPRQGTVVRLARVLPADRPLPEPAALARLSARLVPAPAADGREELLQQNRELVHTLAELHLRHDELGLLTNELEATNRGVVALYAELDERAAELRRSDALKSRFLANMSHELRTPLASIRALSGLLLNRLDGELTAEQERQVQLIRKAAEDLGEMVDDLLDLARIEAGRVAVRAVDFRASALFAALRTMLAPLQTDPAVRLIFEDPQGVPELRTDEAKLTQILRNFVSNALKFTERGEIRVGARLEADGEHVTFFVADTGIGIAPQDQPVIFEEFGQLQNHLQQRIKGTGLGLPLCRKLGALLGGYVGVESEPGVGSTFYVTVPRAIEPSEAVPESLPGVGGHGPGDGVPPKDSAANFPRPRGATPDDGARS